MENKKFNRACELDEEIREIKKEIKLWEISTKIKEVIELEAPVSDGVIYFPVRTYSLKSKYIDFNALKANTLFILEKKLRKLEKEFNEL